LLLYLLFAIDCCIIIIFYPRQSLFSEHTRIQHVTISTTPLKCSYHIFMYYYLTLDIIGNSS